MDNATDMKKSRNKYPASLKGCALFIARLALFIILMLVFRALVFTIYSVNGDALAPEFQNGDRVLVNRWSYGLRTGGANGLFRYGRLCGNPVEKGDIVAFDSPVDSLPGVFVCRCGAGPGDTIRTKDGPVIVPGLATCAPEEHYWMEAIDKSGQIDSRAFGFVPESLIIGRVCMIVYNHDDTQPFFTGYKRDRFMILK